MLTQEALKKRVVFDNHGNQLCGDKLDKAITDKEKVAVYRALYLNVHGRLPRCKYRNWQKAVDADIKLGYSMKQIDNNKGVHSANHHVCEECRCIRIAGQGTRGWWYWPMSNTRGLGEVGHYGVGPCHRHGPHGKKYFGGFQLEKYTAMIESEILSMQDKGMAPDRTINYMARLDEETADHQVKRETRIALLAIKRLAEETCTQLRQHRENGSSDDKYIDRVCNVFGLPADMLGDDERQELLQAAIARPLTELAQGKHVPMSDKTSITLEKDLIKEVGNQAKNVFQVREDDYMLKEDVWVQFRRFLGAVEQIYAPKGDKDDWARLIAEMKSIGHQLGTGEDK